MVLPILSNRVGALSSSALALSLAAWQLALASRDLPGSQYTLEMWLGGILFGEIMAYVLSHPRSGEIAPSKDAAGLFGIGILLLGIIVMMSGQPAGILIGMALPVINLAQGRPFKASIIIVLASATIGIFEEKTLWALPAAIILYYTLHTILAVRDRLRI